MKKKKSENPEHQKIKINDYDTKNIKRNLVLGNWYYYILTFREKKQNKINKKVVIKEKTHITTWKKTT